MRTLLSYCITRLFRKRESLSVVVHMLCVWSAWSRIITCLPLLILSLWSRAWIGRWSILPIAAALLWLWLNPRVSPMHKSYIISDLHGLLESITVFLTIRDVPLAACALQSLFSFSHVKLKISKIYEVYSGQAEKHSSVSCVRDDNAHNHRAEG